MRLLALIGFLTAGLKNPADLVLQFCPAMMLCLQILQESAILERAVKEQERREGDKEGFTNSPGDCLAFKYYRDVSSDMLCLSM